MVPYVGMNAILIEFFGFAAIYHFLQRCQLRRDRRCSRHVRGEPVRLPGALGGVEGYSRDRGLRGAAFREADEVSGGRRVHRRRLVLGTRRRSTYRSANCQFLFP
jgi:hypothetical protein